jgi:hypothetical protein
MKQGSGRDVPNQYLAVLAPASKASTVFGELDRLNKAVVVV